MFEFYSIRMKAKLINYNRDIGYLIVNIKVN